ncbi:MAG: DNA primase [Bacteroidales bacterium]
MITDSIQDQIRSLPIGEVIGHYITLKKKGSDYQASCPFHTEKTSSFSISVKKNIFKCFGCGIAGDGIEFVKQYRQLDFIEACTEIAKNHHIDIPHREFTAKEKEVHDHKQSLYVVNSFAAAFFVDCLNNPDNDSVKEYALSRWDAETLVKFGIGFAPDSWEGLMNHAKTSGVKTEILLEAGLITESKKTTGKLFDTFRNRLMIPIQDPTGHTIGFTGRSLDGSEPKYFNTRETDIYHKGLNLFGFNFAREAIRYHESAYLVEGNADVIKLHSINIPNTVGICGTSLTREQLQILSKTSTSITIIPDTDTAGMRSLDRSAKLIMDEGITCNILLLPKGEEFIDTDGKTKNRKVDADSYFLDFKQFDKYANSHVQDYIIYKTQEWSQKPKTPENTKRAIDEISVLITRMHSGNREVYIDQVSRLIKPKKAWTDRINQIFKEDNPGNDKEEKVDRIPEHVSLVDWEKYGFYQDKNCYYFRTARGAVERGCNFTLVPLFHIESVQNAKRIFRITNEYGITRVIELPQSSLISLGKFKEAVESLGNFLWEVSDVELNKLKRYLYQETKSCLEITQLGWHKDGFYSWGNGIYNGSFTPIDVNGIVTHDEVNYYLPAFSSIWEKELTHYVSERQFIHRTENKVTLLDYSSRLITVFGDNAAIALCFLFASLFRDVIIRKFNFFPILDLFGPKGAGKTELAVSIMSFFGKLGKGPNINNTSKAALADHVSQLRNACAHIDEYKNNIDLDKIEFLKGLWDGTGRTRMNMDKDKKKETTAVDCGVILSGQEMPTADIALFSRLIYLTFWKVQYSDQEKQNFNELKAIEQLGNTHITNEILALRKLFISGFSDSYDQAGRDLTVMLGESLIEDRIFKNWLVVIATYHAIRTGITVSFTYQDILRIAASQVVLQNSETKKSSEISQFWDMVKYMSADGLIHDGIDYRIQEVLQIQTDEMTTPKEFEDPTPVLFVQMSRILMLYRKHSKSSGEKVLPIDSINHYLRNDKRYLGKKRARFRFLDRSGTAEGVWGSRPEWAHCFEYKPLGIDLNSASYNDSEEINEDTAKRMAPGRPSNLAKPLDYGQKKLSDSF